MAIDLKRHVAASAERLTKARIIADALRHDEKLHRLAMIAVFALEDCHETFRRMHMECNRMKPEILP